MRKGEGHIFRNVDWVLIGMWGLLTLLGWLNLYSASYTDGHPSIFDSSQEYGKQFIWICICIGMALVMLIVESSFYTKWAYHIYGVIVLMLVAVLLFGAERNGAKSWFGVGSFGIQPSEFAKFATALVVAKYLSALNIRMEDVKTKMVTAALILVPTGLILLQPDAGTMLVFMSFIFVLYREGLSGNILLLGLLTAVVSVIALIAGASTLEIFGLEINGTYVFIGTILLIGGLGFLMIKAFVLPRNRKRNFFTLFLTVGLSIVLTLCVNLAFDKLLKGHQKDRIEILLGLKQDPTKSYNVDQAMRAIGSGSWTGKGYMEGTLSNNTFKHVPMQSTDFIFCSVGEEWGFLGTTILIMLFVVFLIRIIIVAERQRSKLSRIYGYAVACILFFHLMINIGMAIGLAPVIGIPLPFFSYGGSSLLAFTILIFIFIKLDSDRMEVLR